LFGWVHINMKGNQHIYHVYIMTNQRHTVLYIGMTGKGIERILEHINKIHPGFTSRYNINKLVYYEEYGEVSDAIAREKQLKRWSRKKKVWLIERTNPEWKELLIV